MTVSNTEWDPILVKENNLLSPGIKANKSQRLHRNRREVVKRIASEIEAYEIAMQQPQKVFEGLLFEFCRI